MDVESGKKTTEKSSRSKSKGKGAQGSGRKASQSKDSTTKRKASNSKGKTSAAKGKASTSKGKTSKRKASEISQPQNDGSGDVQALGGSMVATAAKRMKKNDEGPKSEKREIIKITTSTRSKPATSSKRDDSVPLESEPTKKKVQGIKKKMNEEGKKVTIADRS